MPGRTPSQAREAFLAPLRRSLSCVTDAQLIVSSGHEPGTVEALTLSREPLPLRSALPGGLQFRLRQQFRLVQEDHARWRVTTAAYAYRLDDGEGRELAAWHWHPASKITYPHLHVANGPLSGRAHLPTGRVSIESVLRMLLTDLAVPAKRADFAGVLDAAERPFIEHRRWHG